MRKTHKYVLSFATIKGVSLLRLIIFKRWTNMEQTRAKMHGNTACTRPDPSSDPVHSGAQYIGLPFGQIWKQSTQVFGYFRVSFKCLLTYKISYIKQLLESNSRTSLRWRERITRIYKGEGLGFLKEYGGWIQFYRKNQQRKSF